MTGHMLTETYQTGMGALNQENGLPEMRQRLKKLYRELCLRILDISWTYKQRKAS